MAFKLQDMTMSENWLVCTRNILDQMICVDGYY